MRKLTLTFATIVTAALLAFGSTHTKKTNSGWKKYAVYFYDANYYYVTEEISEKYPGTDYLCVSSEMTICAINTFLDPDGYNRIPIGYGWPIYTNSLYISMDY